MSPQNLWEHPQTSGTVLKQKPRATQNRFIYCLLCSLPHRPVPLSCPVLTRQDLAHWCSRWQSDSQVSWLQATLIHCVTLYGVRGWSPRWVLMRGCLRNSHSALLKFGQIAQVGSLRIHGIFYLFWGGERFSGVWWIRCLFECYGSTWKKRAPVLGTSWRG